MMIPYGLYGLSNINTKIQNASKLKAFCVLIRFHKWKSLYLILFDGFLLKMKVAPT